MRLSKKGGGSLEIETLAVLAVIAASAIVIFLFVTRVYSSGIFGEEGRQLCRTTLLGQSLTMYVDENIVPPKCNTYQIKFYEDKVELDGKTLPVLNPETGDSKKSFEKLNDETVNQVVAEQMRLCWWQFWEGKRAFGSAMVAMGLYNKQGDNCFICNEITFDDSVSQKQFIGYYNYIKNTRMQSSEKTYYEYIANSGSMYDSDTYQDKEKLVWEQFADGVGYYQAAYSGKLDLRDPINRDVVFDKDKKHVIVFIREGQKGLLRGSPEETENELDSTMTYFTYVVPYEKLDDICESVNVGERT